MIIAPSRPTRTPVGSRVVLLVLAVLAGVFAMHALPQVPVRAHAHPATAAATVHAPVATGSGGAGRSFGAVPPCGHVTGVTGAEAGRAASSVPGGPLAGGQERTGDLVGAVPAATHGEAAHVAAGTSVRPPGPSDVSVTTSHGEAAPAAPGVPRRAVAFAVRALLPTATSYAEAGHGPAVGAPGPPVVPAAASYGKSAHAAAGVAGSAVRAQAQGPSGGGVSAAAADHADNGAAVRSSGHGVAATDGDRAVPAAAAPRGHRADATRGGEACARAGHGHGGSHMAHADATCAAAGTSHGPALPALVPVRLAPTGAGPGGGPLGGACADRGGRAPPSLSELQLLRI
ncbi:DUF6153 family protein [Streptomyces sp. NPDC101118]|uniref:DUF6153 family protein n=1 Tax=Streptomyces sp. NPDC101118 TaxID=3366109 RepID=UPI0037FAB5A1